MLAYITGTIDQELILRNAYLVTENRIRRHQLKGRLRLWDGERQAPGRPKVDPELEALIVRMAQENRSWGYGRIVGILPNLGYTVSNQAVGKILKRHGLLLAPERMTTMTWKACIRTHMDVLVATDFFTAEVWMLGGS